MDKIILHIDVNNAFLSWSAVLLLKNGYKYDIREKYAIIGGDESKRHGIVLAKSPLAKKLGIKTADTIYSARRKCPQLLVYPPNYKWYQTMSQALFKLLSNYTDDIEICSIDECFLDYTPIKHLYGDVHIFAKNIQKKILDKLGFTVNIGIANNKLCAKMASDFTKPNKIHTLYENEIKTKMLPLPINELYGIGKQTTIKLKQLNINTINDLAQYNVNILSKYFKNQAPKMIDLAKGIDERLVIKENSIRKGISNSITLSHNLIYKQEVYQVLAEVGENLGIDLREEKKYATVISVILKDKYFKSYSHQKKLKNATNITSEIINIAKELFDEMWDSEPIRLVGIRLDNLVSTVTYQLSLFEEIKRREKINKIDEVVDQLKKKYGSSIIKSSATMGNTITKKY
ncbi:MAG: DNA polymerase IV [Bacilli bacterium]